MDIYITTPMAGVTVYRTPGALSNTSTTTGRAACESCQARINLTTVRGVFAGPGLTTMSNARSLNVALLCDDVLAHVFMKIVHKRLFLVCKRWNKIMRELPADTLMTHYIAPLLASTMSYKVKKIPACYYHLMSFAQQVSIPNLLMINADHTTPILKGYRYCIPWGTIIDWMSSNRDALSAIQALERHNVCPYEYIMNMFYRYEQYRRHVLITHQVVPSIGKYVYTLYIPRVKYHIMNTPSWNRFVECVGDYPGLLAEALNELDQIISKVQVVSTTIDLSRR